MRREEEVVTPVTVPPQLGTQEAGPKSGAHTDSFSWGGSVRLAAFLAVCAGGGRTFSWSPSYSPARICGIVFLYSLEEACTACR